MAYQDRGIMKWGGFFLSEHSEQMERLKEQRPWKSEMTETDIQVVLREAMLHQAQVEIQCKLAAYDPDREPDADVVGRIAGFEDGYVILRTENGLIQVALDRIQHVRSKRGAKKWYE
ncbi:hypothetical protein MFLO_09332 [Listeria floridensis FSL S10-1187]|uniref:DNA-directed RNA polymerase beta subunit n=1 Tax=Listeria floridensis FSL S10-1187 TaxID=1265817 RepID=A0ABP3AZL6_9LIST|nr:hypothetical protein [Listeria floridensis]EUJ31244.1 hypothetical protein MFLO_09332 [Listeria floridensis FSL S10-1187]